MLPKYEGPEVFEELIYALHTRVSPFLSRDDVPHIIVGGIGQISNEGEYTIVKGDSETSKTIDDEYHKLVSAKEEEKEHYMQSLLDACDAANILKGSCPGEYNNSIDVVILSPNQIARFALACRKDPRKILRANDDEAKIDYLMDMYFPNWYAHNLIHWDSGSSKFNRDLRRYFHAIDYGYDKAINGKFSEATDNTNIRGETDASVLRKESEESAMLGKDAEAKLTEHFAKMMGLGIYRFDELVAEICAPAIIPPPLKSDKPLEAPQKATDRMRIALKRKGPRGFLRYAKEIIKEAYDTNTNVFDLI